MDKNANPRRSAAKKDIADNDGAKNIGAKNIAPGKAQGELFK